MKFKIDENLPVAIAEMLRSAGYDGLSVLEQDLGGSTDALLRTLCQRESRILVTLDMDFADIRTYPPGESPGLIVFRLSHQDKPHVLDVFARTMQLFQTHEIEKRLWIVEENRVRIREQPW